jgi:hypothetical protein
MPRKPSKRVTKRADSVLSWELHLYLSQGFTFFLDETPSWEETKRLWKIYRAQIMATIGENYPQNDERRHLHVPWGTRPYCWWRYESRGPRRLISGDPSAAIVEYGYWWGMPKVYMSSVIPVYESQPAYLRRHGLLMEGEEERILPEAETWN